MRTNKNLLEIVFAKYVTFGVSGILLSFGEYSNCKIKWDNGKIFYESVEDKRLSQVRSQNRRETEFLQYLTCFTR